MTLELPRRMAQLVSTAPMTMSAKPAHAMRGVARRARSRVEEVK